MSFEGKDYIAAMRIDIDYDGIIAYLDDFADSHSTNLQLMKTVKLLKLNTDILNSYEQLIVELFKDRQYDICKSCLVHKSEQLLLTLYLSKKLESDSDGDFIKKVSRTFAVDLKDSYNLAHDIDDFKQFEEEHRHK